MLKDAVDEKSSYLLRLDVPEDYGCLWRCVCRPVLSLVCVYDCATGEIGPLVIGADVGEVDEGVDGQSDAEGAALPRASGDLTARDLMKKPVFSYSGTFSTVLRSNCLVKISRNIKIQCYVSIHYL